MITMTKTKPLLLAGASVLLCASSLVVFVLEIDRAIAWIAPGSPRHNNRNQNQIKNQNRVVFLFSAVDESSSERLQEPQPPLPAAGQFSKHNTNNNYFTGSKEGAIENKHEHGISKQQALPTEPMVLEERLLSDHAALESFLSETDYETKQSGSIVPNAPFIAEDVPREATLVDRSVYEFNNNLVNLMYSAISFLYPTTSLSQPLLAASLSSTLLGTKYNEETIEPERKTALRFEKFYVVQTVARIPYFAYLSVLHLRETYGDRGGSKGEKQDINKNQREVDLSSSFSLSNHQRIETMRTHYAQADNEFHHLLIMEALGGDSIREIDRILAHTMAFFYYWFVVALFSWNEQAAYHLNEVAEDHAYKIYEEFLALHEDELRALPVPEVARKYYEDEFRRNPNFFKAFCAVSKSPMESHHHSQTSGSSPRRDNRPHELHSLYDVFLNVRDDEKEHWMALCNLVQYDNLTAVDEASVKSTGTRGM